MPYKPLHTVRIIITTATLAGLLSIIYPLSPVYASINEAFTYQGKIVNDDGTNLTNTDASCILTGSPDTCDFRISIYDDPAAGTLRWQETKSDIELYDTDDIFNLILDCGGTFSDCNQNGGPDFTSGTLYISVEFDPDGDGDFAEGETFSPRRELTAVPYAFNAQNADQLEGNAATAFLRSDTSSSVSAGNILTIDGTIDINGGLIVSDETVDFDGASTTFTFAGDFSVNNDDIYVDKTNGTVGIGTTNPLAYLDISAATVSIPSLTINAGVQPGNPQVGDMYASGGNLFFWSGLDWDDLTAGASGITLQDAYVGGNTIDILNAQGNLIIDVQEKDYIIEVGGAGDTGDFQIHDGTNNWYFIDESTSTVTFGEPASGGITVDGGTGTINLGNSNNAKTINLGTGNAADVINIGTDASTGDTIVIGNSNIASTLSLTAGDDWSISTAGAIAGVTTFASSDDWSWTAATPTITLSSGETFTITDGTDSFVINTTDSSFTFGDGSNIFSFDVDSGPSYSGNARPSKTITLTPEYPGAVLTDFYGAGTDSSTTGTMNSDSETTPASSIKNYYQWERGASGQHFYTVAVRFTLPQDFNAWQTSNALVVNYITESATSTNSDLDVRVYLEGNGTVDASSTDNASVTWSTVSFGSSDLDLWNAAGETAVIYLRLGSASNNFARVGDITLSYYATY